MKPENALALQQNENNSAGPGKTFIWVAIILVALAPIAWLTLDHHITRDNFDDISDIMTATPWADGFEEFGKGLVPIWIMGVIALIKKRRRLLVAGLLALCLVGVSVNITKKTVARPRPRHTTERIEKRQEEGRFVSYSMPSGDTAVAFAAAGVLVTAASGWGWKTMIFTVAALIGAWRAPTLRHYPSDILMGAAFGLVSAWLALKFTPKLARKWPGVFDLRSRPVLYTLVGLFAATILAVLVGAFSGALEFLATFGPLMVCLLVLMRGRVWLRWLASEGVDEGRRARFAFIGLMLFGALTIIPSLGWTTLLGTDEGYYAGSALEMMQRGDFFVPHYSGEPWLEKPPLTYWAMILSFYILGPTAFAARLPSALGALASMGLLFKMGRRMFGVAAGTIAALALGVAVMFAGASRMALLDTPLVACMILSMYGLWKIMRGEERGGWWLFYIGAGLGILAKGPLGLALPVIGLFGVMAWTRRWDIFRKTAPVRGALVVAVIAGAWAVPASWLSHGEYFYELVWIRTIRPVFVPLQGHGGRNLGQYLLLLPAYIPIVVVAFLPWSIPLFSGGLRSAGPQGGWRGNDKGLLAGWFLAQLLIFSLVRTKLPHHILPLLPIMALLFGAMTAESLFRRTERRRARREFIGLLAVMFLLAIALAIAPFYNGFAWISAAFFPSAVAAVATGVAAARWAKRGRRDGMVVALSAGVSVCLALWFSVGMHTVNYQISTGHVSRFLMERYDDDLDEIALGAYDYRDISLVFHVRRPVERVRELDDFMWKSPAALILRARDVEDALDSEHGDGWKEIWRRNVWLPWRQSWREIVILERN